MTMETIAFIATCVSIGLVLGLAIIVVWSGVGFLVAVFEFYNQPPRRPATGACGTCSDLQALWNSLNGFEKLLAFPNFFLAKVVCDSQGCPVELNA